MTRFKRPRRVRMLSARYCRQAIPLATVPGLTCDATGVYVDAADGQVLWLARMVAPNRFEVHPLGGPVQAFWGLLPDEVARVRLAPPRVAQQKHVARHVARLWQAHRSRVLPITMGPTRDEMREAWIAHWRAWRMETS